MIKAHSCNYVLFLGKLGSASMHDAGMAPDEMPKRLLLAQFVPESMNVSEDFPRLLPCNATNINYIHQVKVAIQARSPDETFLIIRIRMRNKHSDMQIRLTLPAALPTSRASNTNEPDRCPLFLAGEA